MGRLFIWWFASMLVLMETDTRLTLPGWAVPVYLLVLVIAGAVLSERFVVLAAMTGC